MAIEHVLWSEYMTIGPTYRKTDSPKNQRETIAYTSVKQVWLGPEPKKQTETINIRLLTGVNQVWPGLAPIWFWGFPVFMHLP